MTSGLSLARNTVPRLVQLRTRSVQPLVLFTPRLRSYSTHLRLAGDGGLLATSVGCRSSCDLKDNSIARTNYTTSSANAREPVVHELFEPVTGSWQYVVADGLNKSAVIIDPVLDYDPAKAALSTESAETLIKTVMDKGYVVEMILETHVHADHVTAASYLQSRLVEIQGRRPLIGIGSQIKMVQSMFGKQYNIPIEEYDGVFDKLWEDGEEFAVGNLTAQAIHLPGHTPDHMGYKIGNNIFVGDSIFHSDIGSARTDFPGGSAKAIFHSGRKILGLPDETKIWVGHDYPPAGRDSPVPFMTVKQQRETNKHLKDNIIERDFIDMRRKRDESLAAPRLLHPSLQINIRAGRLPLPTASGRRMVHLPLVLPTVAW